MADQSACAAGDGFEYVSAVDRAPVDRLKGEFDEQTWKIARAAVADVPVPALRALLQGPVEKHWAPVIARPENVLWRPERSEQLPDLLAGDACVKPFVDIPDSPSTHSAAPGPSDTFTVSLRLWWFFADLCPWIYSSE